MVRHKVVPYSLKTLDDTLKNILANEQVFKPKDLVPLVKVKMLKEKEDPEVLDYIRLRLEKGDAFKQYGLHWGTEKIQDQLLDIVEEVLVQQGEPIKYGDIRRKVRQRTEIRLTGQELSLAKDGRFVQYDDLSWGLSHWRVRDVIESRHLDRVYKLLVSNAKMNLEEISQQLFKQSAEENNLEDMLHTDKRFSFDGEMWLLKTYYYEASGPSSSSEEILGFLSYWDTKPSTINRLNLLKDTYKIVRSSNRLQGWRWTQGRWHKGKKSSNEMYCSFGATPFEGDDWFILRLVLTQNDKFAIGFCPDFGTQDKNSCNPVATERRKDIWDLLKNMENIKGISLPKKRDKVHAFKGFEKKLDIPATAEALAENYINTVLEWERLFADILGAGKQHQRRDPANPTKATSFDADHAIVKVIKERLNSLGGKATVNLYKGGTFEIWYSDTENGVACNKIPLTGQLTWEVLVAAYELVIAKEGRVEKGNARAGKLGSARLPLDSLEGHIAHTVHGVQPGQSAFGPGFVICAILDWAGVCKNERGYLAINPEFLNKTE